MSEELRENKMGTMPVRRLVLSMSLPMMIAMLVQALYNVVDSYFVAKLSENALTAVGMVFPFQNLMIAVGVGTGVGVNAFLSRSLGEKNYDAANRAAENGVFLAVLSTLVFTVAGLTLAHPFIAVQTDIPDIVSSGTAYMRICGGLSFGLFLEIMFERLLQATGRTFYTMLTQGTGAIINIIMDPVLIFGLGPFPRMEVAGAAAATVLGQIVAAVLAVLFNLTCNHDIHPTLRGFRPNGPVKHLLRGRAVHHSQLHRLGDDLRYEPDPVRLLVHRRGRVQCVFQAPELRVHAGVRPQQRHGAHRLLQLRRP